MSAWSSSTGKAQLSYADRLRQASKSTATTKQDASPPTSFATRALPQEATKTSSPSASLSAAGAPSRRLSSASSTGGAATTLAGASRLSATPSDTRTSTASAEPSATPLATNGPPVNIWEARRKQLADREAEKERERQAALAQQKKASPATATSSAAATANKSKQTPASPRKGNERLSKGSAASNQSDRKSNKPTNSSSSRTSNSVSIPSSTPSAAAPIQDKVKVSATASRPNYVAPPTKTAKADNRVAQEAPSAPRPEAPSAPVASTQSTASSNKTSKAKVDDNAQATDAAKVPSKQQDQAAKALIPAQSAAAQVPPSSALSVQTGSAQPYVHDDIPGSPATVASAIEEVLKNGGAHGAQTEEDDAWLARIHLLNGGQNMPKFGGFGPNGVSGLSDEAEMRAAKKAERAVAAAWGAGKSVWNKSQQARTDVGKDTPSDVVKETMSQGANVNSKDSGSGAPPTAVAVNGTSGETKDTQASDAKESQKAATASDEKPDATVADASVGKQKPRVPADQQKPVKSAVAHSKASAASVPPFEDVNNWPSPLDAGKKQAEKPRAVVGPTDQDKSEANKASQSKTPKSLYETLDELQVRIAPGSNPQQPGGAAGARKGKQQWVSIVPEITHTSTPASGARVNRPLFDAKAGKGANKQQQQRKDANKGAGQTHQGAQGAKKDGANNSKAARAEDKWQAREGAVDASTGTKASDSRGKDESRGSVSTQNDKAGGAVNKLNAKFSDGQSTPAKSFKPSSQSQTQEAEQVQTKDAESASVSTEKQAGSTPAPTSSARDELPAKQAQHVQQPRTNLRPNGVSTSSFQPYPNGVRAPKSGASSGSGTPVTNRSSPRGSVASSPNVHALPRAAAQLPNDPISTPYGVQPPALFYGPSGAATPMLSTAPTNSVHGAPWLPYNPYARPAAYMFDATAQTGAPLPAGVLGQLLGQIEFYFSQHNLQGDFFLRQKMDAQGWVDIAVVAGFKRVQGITRDIGMVKDALLHSAVLDVDEPGMKVRRRFGWELYTLALSPAAAAVGETRMSGNGNADEKEVRKATLGGEEDEKALGVVAASGFGGALEA
ncbi:uncharacterized protein SPSC_04076 [Sporisorium scitamineum]|uniref:HTH La-type RNA-binding domain-containing protein n=1 Tax=Sporisorium scitamineum TaxID=49012 RepID=A0A0F7RXH1_9BASI|nr:hypothetical protein [Sporisorium scitamineum]CDU24575.1 uncharacterized protein SPSC_04076 [Sporisorium scitamineum]